MKYTKIEKELKEMMSEDEFISEVSFSPWQNFVMLQKSKKYLYISTGTILLVSLTVVILLGISVSKMHSIEEIVLSCIAIALTLVIFGAGIIQVGIFKEKDLIIAM